MYPKNMELGGIKIGHVQGIATDAKRQYMYYSCTTFLAKTDMQGNLIGTVKGLAGHLGCIAYHYDDGKVYASLEYKHDSIGSSILAGVNEERENTVEVLDGFYVAVFDVDKINAMDMDAEKDGIMTVVHLKEVLDDYSAHGHRYGCSGIDGITFAPIPGSVQPEKYLYVAYGIYGDTARQDNDYQVILRYDISGWDAYKKPLVQEHMHRWGPEKPDSKYFVYTGNTTFGIQNLEYDGDINCMFAAVYRGSKEMFPNYPMYAIDMNQEARLLPLKHSGETCQQLTLATLGRKHAASQINGIEFPYGTTGMISLGEGLFYFSRDFYDDQGAGTNVGLYRFDGKGEFIEI